MNKLLMVVLVLLVVIAGLLGIWFSLDEHTRCSLIYGKNICNFYAMMNIATSNPSTSDFNRMMSLCSAMGNVPKKDGCFEFVAETFADIDIDKAKEACNGIKEIGDQVGNIVHKKEECHNKIEKLS